jgi:hypothetical protein
MNVRTGGRNKDSAQDAKLEAVLDEALEQTFPASDPFSVGQSTATEPPSRPVDRKPPGVETARKPQRRRR